MAFLASSLVFGLASMLVPRLMLGLQSWDLVLIVVVVLAALAARTAVLLLVMPVLHRTKLAERIPVPFKVTMIWGGLRGSITLAMALAVTENQPVPADVQRFVAILATGFVLFTLLVNGTTLRFLVTGSASIGCRRSTRRCVTKSPPLGLAPSVTACARPPPILLLPEPTQRVVDSYDRRAAEEAPPTCSMRR